MAPTVSAHLGFPDVQWLSSVSLSRVGLYFPFSGVLGLRNVTKGAMGLLSSMQVSAAGKFQKIQIFHFIQIHYKCCKFGSSWSVMKGQFF
jgi:hypothetical protein